MLQFHMNLYGLNVIYNGNQSFPECKKVKKGHILINNQNSKYFRNYRMTIVNVDKQLPKFKSFVFMQNKQMNKFATIAARLKN